MEPKTYIEINGERYLAQVDVMIDYGEFYGKRICTIDNLHGFTVEEARRAFSDGVEWNLVIPWMTIEHGEEVEKETVESMSAVNILERITLHRDDSLTIVLREESDLEQAYELLYGGIE